MSLTALVLPLFFFAIIIYAFYMYMSNAEEEVEKDEIDELLRGD